MFERASRTAVMHIAAQRFEVQAIRQDASQAKLPWIQIKRFEAWFWTTSRRKWIDSSAAATVLARRYMRQVKEDMSWGKTTADLKQRVRL